jgi:hypothetical protein
MQNALVSANDTTATARFGLFDRIGEAFFFATVGAAVDEYQATHNAEWVAGAEGAGERP